MKKRTSKKTKSPATGTVSTLQLEHVCIPCPHITVTGNDIDPIWRITPNGQLIDLPGDKKLVLCSECWKVVRCECFDHTFKEMAKFIARTPARL